MSNEKTRPAVVLVWHDQREVGKGVTVYLKNGWSFKEGAHMRNFSSETSAYYHVTAVIPCRCATCRAEAPDEVEEVQQQEKTMNEASVKEAMAMGAGHTAGIPLEVLRVAFGFAATRGARSLVRAAESVLRATKDPRQLASKPTISTDFEGFKKMAGEFFRAAPESEVDAVEAGFNCLSLAYIGMDGSQLEIEQAAQVIKLATVELIAAGARR